MLRVEEILKAVKGKLLSGDPRMRVSGVSTDSRKIRRRELFFAIKGERFDGHNFIPQAVDKGAAAVIIQRAIKGLPCSGKGKQPACIRVADTRAALGDLARFYRQRFNIPVIAITGSNGKTTTKEMLAWILSAKLRVLKNSGSENNEIGLPQTLLKLNSTYDIAVLELGTNHFNEIAYLSSIACPNLGIITNVGPAHLKYFKSLEGIYKEKASLLEYLAHPKIAVLNSDDRRLARLAEKRGFFVVTYGIKKESDFKASGLKIISNKSIEFQVNPVSGDSRKIRLNSLAACNVYNALAAIAVTRIFGCSYRQIRSRLSAFIPLQGRLKVIQSKGITFIDDSYNANPASLKEALAAFNSLNIQGRRILLLGDMLELGDSTRILHRRMGSLIAASCDALISVGRLSRAAAQGAYKSGLNKEQVFCCRNSREARNLLFKKLKPCRGDLVLVKGSRLMRMEEVIKPASS